jgi:serine/threonine-protein kinase
MYRIYALTSHLQGNFYISGMTIAERYKILHPLGSQKVRKFAAVYLVEERASGQKGVLKALRPDPSNALAVAQLREEAGFNFETDGLPRTLDFFETEQEIMLVRSYAPGVPLDEFKKHLYANEYVAFMGIFLEKFQALFAELHRQGVAHADLKPGNILIEGEPENFKVHLIDFGLAIRYREPTLRKMVFPLGFAAPELLLNHLDLVDQRSDIFALGIVFWRFFTGKLPLVHPNPSIYTNLQLTHPLPDDDALPKGLHAILEKMSRRHVFQLPPNQMEIEDVTAALLEGRNGRYATLEEILQDLYRLPKPAFYQRMSLRQPRLKLKMSGL